MKKIRAIVTLIAFIAFPLFTLADPPGPPPPPGQPGAPGGGGQTPVGAPLDGGTWALLILGAGYGGWKLYQLRKNSGPREVRE
jgi:hypothetical protein